MQRGYLIAGLAGVVVALVAPAGAWLYGKAQYQTGRRDAQSAHELAELQAFRRDATRLGELAASLAATGEVLRAARPRLIEDYKHATIALPLPAGCRPDDGRVQHITDAYSAARAARGAGAPLR